MPSFLNIFLWQSHSHSHIFLLKKKSEKKLKPQRKNFWEKMFLSQRKILDFFWVSCSVLFSGNFIVPGQLFSSHAWCGWQWNPFCKSWENNISKAIKTSNQRIWDSNCPTSFQERSSSYWIWLHVWEARRRKQKKQDHVYARKDPFLPSSLLGKPV